MSATEAPHDLPDLVRRYLSRTLPDAGGTPASVRIAQEGEMWLKPGGHALRFTAVEELAVDRVTFTWRARFRLGLRTIDSYTDGEGALEARILGLRVMRQHGPDLSLGEAMRYLAELPWVPHAMQANRELRWEELDARTVQVSSDVGTRSAAVQLHFDGGGDIARASATHPYPQGNTATTMPWSGAFSDYAVLAGVRLPTSAEVQWELPSGPFIYWRGRIASFEAGSY